MSKLLFSKTKKVFALLAVMVGLGAGQAVADTTIGTTDTGWGKDGSHTTTAYTIEPNKTLSVQFVVNATLGSENWDAWMTILRSADAWATGTEYLVMRGDCYGVRNGDWVWDNKNNTGNGNWFTVNLNNHDWDNFKTNLVDLTVNLTVKRLGKEVILIQDFTTASSQKSRHYFVMDCEDGTQNIYAFLAADHSQITIDDSKTTITDTETITGTLCGVENNAGGFGTGNRVDFTIAPNATLTLHFKNYTNRINSWNNWVFEMQQDDQYADWVMGGNNWGTLIDNNSFDGSTWPSDYGEMMDGTDVVMTIVRNDANVTVTAVHTPVNGDPFTGVFSFTPAKDGFASADAVVRLLTDGSHIDLLSASTTVSEYGWSTFSSNCALDFSDPIDGLTAYMVTGHDGNTLTLSEVTGTVPAGTGLLLNGTAGVEYNIPIVGSSDTDVSSNLLIAGTGATVSAEGGKTKYVLGVNGSNAEFQKINATAATVAAGKAYLQFNEAIEARILTFNGEATGIQNVSLTAGDDAAIYSLNGQRVSKATKGVYVKNGKKIIIK